MTNGGILLILLVFFFSCLKLPKLLRNAKVCNVSFKSTLCTFKRMTNNHAVEVQTLEFELIVLHYFLFLWKLTVL